MNSLVLVAESARMSPAIVLALLLVAFCSVSAVLMGVVLRRRIDRIAPPNHSDGDEQADEED